MGKLKEIPLHCMTITADLIHLLLSKYTVNFITFHFSEIKHTYEKKKIHIFIPLKTKADRYQPLEYYVIIRNIKSDLSQRVLLFT